MGIYGPISSYFYFGPIFLPFSYFSPHVLHYNKILNCYKPPPFCILYSWASQKSFWIKYLTLYTI